MKPTTRKPSRSYTLNDLLGDDLICGLDSEYVTGAEKNDVVSYQGYVLSNPNPYEWIEIMEPGRRLTLAEVVGRIIQKGLDEGFLERCPARVVLAIHWSLAELTSLQDFRKLKSQFDGIRNTYVTLGKAFRSSFKGKDGKRRKIEVSVFDTTLLAPDKHRKLQALGDLLGLKKLEVSQEEISNVREFFANDPVRFQAYGIRDAEIAARWLQRMGEFRKSLTGSPDLPLTLGQIATEFVQTRWKPAGISHHEVLGTEETVNFKGSRKSVPMQSHHHYLTLATEGFHGGRNETYFYGASPIDEWGDWDINGAYVTALCALGTPDWDRIRVPRSVDEFTSDHYGVALVRFRFPDDVRFPCLPVRTRTSLIFPLQGESFATSPEIELARRLGAAMEIVNDTAYLMPMREERPFLGLAREIAGLRERYSVSGNECFEHLCKTVGNSIYGKLCQGLQRKRVFDTREGQMKDLPPSKITNAFLANMVTGMVRAFLGELINRLPRTRMVISATTDGFISNATEAEVMAAALGPLGLKFRDFRHSISADDHAVLKLKHRAMQVLAWRTRGQATLEGYDGFRIILAKAGISAPTSDKEEQNEFIVKTFIEREGNDRYEIELFRTLRQIHDADGALDVGKYKQHIAYRMDFDWKRLPTSERGTSPILGIDHVWFRTQPLPNAAVYQRLRDSWHAFTRENQRVLKSESDLADFEGYMAIERTAGLKRSRKKDPEQNAVLKLFLRAYAHEELGLKRVLANRQLLDCLESAGFSLKLTDVENAKRAKSQLKLHCLRPTPAVTGLLERLQRLFPTFEADRLISKAGDLFEYAANKAEAPEGQLLMPGI
ncbi:hypothetical protein OJ996_05485 [Luteolibacter sp. GHJ8]|uniref:DNA-directed DNA polymerase n=1 Tax=Luteolibacter rhizosphaerae TaxID=2989719 RepID=A0ABT3FZJ1_9BACT|nr:hypothetical protein [Luteolibacter rhizosphaerae]MCW1913012.1 hypothetical protein [Luteolibacter rhizosphaerae]